MQQFWATSTSMIHLTDSRLTRKVLTDTPFKSLKYLRTVLQKNIDFIALLWEDFAFQIDNRDVKKQEKMYYPRFTKAIIHHFISKDKSISMRNRMFMHIAQDDIILGTLRFVSKDEDTQVYASAYTCSYDYSKDTTLQPENQRLSCIPYWNCNVKPKRIYKKHDSPMIKTTTTSPKETPSKKKSSPANKDVSSKKPSRKYKRETHSLQLSGSGDRVGSQPKVPDKPKGKKTSTNEGTGTKPGVPDVPKDQSKSENKSWGESADDDDSNDDDMIMKDLSRLKKRNTNLNQNDDDIEEEYEEEYYMHAKLKDIDHGEEGKGDAEMTSVGHDNVTQDTTYDQVEDDAHVTLKSAHFTQKTEGPLQSSSVSSDFTTQFLILDNVPQADNEIISHDEVFPTTTIPLLIHPFTPLPQLSTSTPTEATTSLPVLKEEAKSEIEKYMEFIEKSVKANVIDQDKDEDPPAGSDQGLKRRKTSKDAEPSKGPKLKESKLSSPKAPSLAKSSGVFVGLSQWLEKMESVFHISGCAIENQVKFATCTLLGAALTWWNGHVRTLGHDSCLCYTWRRSRKKLTDKYCPKG
ncbi:hypothetical protein Tco_0087255 [Tanacetum coccineum]